MADIEVTLLKCPELPNTIQGDGRYLMSLLKDYLEAITVQTNLANGFSAEEINPELGKYPTPRNFFLSFNRLGGEFSWSHLSDISELAYYELRTNTNIGEQTGLLERTIDINSYVMPTNRSGSVFLYAVNKNGDYSNPAEIKYAKAFPDSPADIAITPSASGQLITFGAIPTNCIGANIYVDGVQYSTKDNVFILTDDLPQIKTIEVAYYDQFGEGERGVLYLRLPDVTNFLVERNGTALDFYWDPINVSGVKYLVKVCSELSWELGTELFRTATNDKNRRLYPNTGEYYLMVKAYNDNGSYSENFAYSLIGHELEIDKNIILNYDQQDTLYSGNKINVHYDAISEGVTLNPEATRGEYIFAVNLDQEYKARSWLEYNAISVTESNLTWEDADMTWNEITLFWSGIIGDADSSSFKQELSYRKTGSDSDELFASSLNVVVNAESGEIPTESKHTSEGDFAQARFLKGLRITDLTRLAYSPTKMRPQFSMSFWLKTEKELVDSIILSLKNGNNGLVILYDTHQEAFVLRGSDGKENIVNVAIPSNRVDYICVGIVQSATQRTLYIYKFSTNETLKSVVDATPISTFTQMYCYPKL